MQLNDSMLSTDGVWDDFDLSTLACLEDLESPLMGETFAAQAKSSDPLLTQAITSSCTSDHPALNHMNGPYASTHGSPLVAHSKIKERCLEKLSEIIMRLFDQLTTISDSSINILPSPAQHANNIAGCLSAYSDCNERMTLIGEVFCKSQELIQVLEAFEPISAGHEPFATVVGPNAGIGFHSSSKTPLFPDSPDPQGSSSSSSLKEFSNSRPSMSRASSTKSIPRVAQTGFDRLSCTGADILPTLSHSSSRTEFEPDHPFSTNLDPSTFFQMDIPIIILIVTCHNRLIKIYTALFTRYIRVLQDDPSAADRSFLPEILPGLNLGGFKPFMRRSLQISIIVDTSLYMISQIETYLQRLDRNRSDRRSGTQVPGLQLMDLVTKEIGSGPHENGGYSNQLREHIKTIQRLIRNEPN